MFPLNVKNGKTYFATKEKMHFMHSIGKRAHSSGDIYNFHHTYRPCKAVIRVFSPFYFPQVFEI